MSTCLASPLSLAQDHYLIRVGIGESDWIFKNVFLVAESDLAAPHVDLIFDGLDTFAAVTLVSHSFHLRHLYISSHRLRMVMKYSSPYYGILCCLYYNSHLNIAGRRISL